MERLPLGSRRWRHIISGTSGQFDKFPFEVALGGSKITVRCRTCDLGLCDPCFEQSKEQKVAIALRFIDMYSRFEYIDEKLTLQESGTHETL